MKKIIYLISTGIRFALLPGIFFKMIREFIDIIFNKILVGFLLLTGCFVVEPGEKKTEKFDQVVKCTFPVWPLEMQC